MWSQLNRQFHSALSAAADRPRMLELIEANLDNADRFVRARISGVIGRERPQREHRQILRACRAGDAERVGQFLEQHIAHTQKRMGADPLRRREVT